MVDERKRLYREAHKEEIAEYQRAYRTKHKEMAAEYHRGYRVAHKAALTETNRIYREENKERLAETRHQHYAENKERFRRYKRTSTSRYNDCKCAAVRRSLPFDLTFEQFECLTSQPCMYCGGWSRNEKDICFVGVDRIDNSKGYTLENCLPCCKIHNLMRGKLTVDQLLDNVESIATRM